MRFEKSDAGFAIVIMLSRLGMMIVDQLHCAGQMLEGGEKIGCDVGHSGPPMRPKRRHRPRMLAVARKPRLDLAVKLLRDIALAAGGKRRTREARAGGAD